jgi:hypothetical protein
MCRPERLFRTAVLVLLGLCGSYLAAEVLVAGTLGLPLDDGWIHCAYARNLARGAGLSLANPGEWIPGSTAPLWTFLLAGLFQVLGPGLLAAKVLGIGCAVFALWAVARLVRTATGSELQAGVAVLVLAATPRFVAGAVSGMEVPLYVALCAFGLAEHLGHRTGSLQRWCLAPLLLALAGWARPELFVFVGLVAAHRFAGTWRRDRAWALSALALPVLFLLPYPAYHLALYGHPLPTTFYVKAADESLFSVWSLQGAGPALRQGAANALREAAAFLSYVPGHLPLLAVGLWSGVRRGWQQRNGVPFLAVSLLLFAAARGLLSYTGPWVQSGRYFAHAWPLVLAIAVHGVAHTRALVPLSAALLALALAAAFAAVTLLPDPGLFLWDVGRVTPALAAHEPWWIWAPGALFLAVALAAGAGQPAPAAPRHLRVCGILCGVYLLASNVPGAWLHGRHVLDTNTVNVAMAREVARRIPREERIACHDIGALGFFTEHRLLDLAGIASPEILFERRTPGRPPAVAWHLMALRPRYLCVLDGWLGKLFPEQQPIAGLQRWNEVHRITHKDNVTVGGEVYYLYELVWE